MLGTQQVDSYNRDGFLLVSGLFDDSELDELSVDLDRIIEDYGKIELGWPGPWREVYLAEDERQKTTAVFLQDLQFWSAAWGRVLFHRGMTECLTDLLGTAVQWHHTQLHAKPPNLGTPFPMHQDYPFYPHDGPEYIDILLHLDDSPADSGCLLAVPGSHTDGPLEHITGDETAPHLPTDKYNYDLCKTVPIPAKRGDLIFFSYYLIHSSEPNRSDQWRRVVRFGYHAAHLLPVGHPPDTPYNKIVSAGYKSSGRP